MRAARREYRLRQVQPLIERASRRLAAYQELIAAGTQSGPAPLEQAWQRLQATDLLADMGFISISTEAFLQALDQAAETDSALRRTCMEAIEAFELRTAGPKEKADLKGQLAGAASPFAHR